MEEESWLRVRHVNDLLKEEYFRVCFFDFFCSFGTDLD